MSSVQVSATERHCVSYLVDGSGPAGAAPEPKPVTAPAQSSDDEFVRTLTDRFGRGLFAFVMGLTHDRDRTDDIVQMTLIKAWRSRDKLATAGDSARTWLYTVARRTVIDDYRARAARPVLLTGDLRATDRADATDRVVLTIAIRQALGTLTESHRQAVVLSLLHHRTAAEAAKILGISEGTVKSRVHYGLRALRKALGEPDVATHDTRARHTSPNGR
jgi:RNA polymerase sigma-70 factor (ECF subfamily)